jgi:tRNA(fMet)-specific endonuclease VapC
MAKSVFIFDSNHISSLLRPRYKVLLNRISNDETNTLVLCEPVIYEVEKGLLHKNAEQQFERFQDMLPLFTVMPIQLVDWRVAAVLWATARQNGKQLADIDLLVAAVALRLGGTVVTNDKDFAHLPTVPTENWLQ